MQHWALEYLACPQSGASLKLHDFRLSEGEIVSGRLVSADGRYVYPIEDGIPRFVKATNYCESFGLQWNSYSRLRSDRYNGTSLIRDTILQRTRWEAGHLLGKTLLECGCGCGNDTEVLLDLGASRVLAFDMSNSVISAQRNVRDPRVTFVQADIFRLPLRPTAFDVVFCHRMIQHTPDPERAFDSIIQYARPNGEVLLHSYDKHWVSMMHWKYALRPLTKRLDARTLLRWLSQLGRPLYGIQTPLLRRFGRNKYLHFALSRAIPFYNYSQVHRAAGSGLTDDEVYDISLLDTFDALAPAYDLPNTAETIAGWFQKAGLSEIETTNRNPVFVKGRTPEHTVISRRLRRAGHASAPPSIPSAS